MLMAVGKIQKYILIMSAFFSPYTNNGSDAGLVIVDKTVPLKIRDKQLKLRMAHTPIVRMLFLQHFNSGLWS